jgi:hypothetical protein
MLPLNNRNGDYALYVVSLEIALEDVPAASLPLIAIIRRPKPRRRRVVAIKENCTSNGRCG